MRNEDLLTLRDTKILSRYNSMYWTDLMRDEEIYKILEREFFLKQKTLYNIVLKMSKLAELEDKQIA